MLLKINWQQDGNKVFFDYKGQEIFFIMPDGFKLEETHPDLLKLAEYFMFSPWHEVLGDYQFSRKPGKKTGLNFSAGVDSTAAMIMLPEDTPLVYVERFSVDDGCLKQDNAFRMIEKMERDVICVKTNFELIRTLHGLSLGYSMAISMGVPLILLGDFLDLGKVSYGKVLDDQYFTTGIFRDYTKQYIFRQDLLKSAGLEGFYPTVGCSEVITTRIVDKSEYADYAFSCLRSPIPGEQCNDCFKCFRKNILRNKDANMDGQTLVCMYKNPPKMATSLMYAVKYAKLNINILNEFLDREVEIFDRYYFDAYQFYDEKGQKEIQDRFAELGFSPMTKEDVEKLKALSFIRKNEEVEKNLPVP